jgi:AraC family transcriptional regulator, regulatory protein of adaptative response / methylated-DNA-[protein]-cysteine methyltransferase
MARFPKRPKTTDEIGMSGEEIRYAFEKSSLGFVLIACSEKGVVSISLGEDFDELLGELQYAFPQAHLVPGDRGDKSLAARVVKFIETPDHDLDLPLDMRGTPFQRRVWRAVREVPIGKTATYSEIARKIGAPKAMRAVGSACATSRLALAIPCHRILRSDGSFSGSPDWIDRQGILMGREIATNAPSKTGNLSGKSRSPGKTASLAGTPP